MVGNVSKQAGSIRLLVAQAERALIRGQINHALLLVHDFVERIITDPICTAQVFASRSLDQLCLHIGRQSQSRLGAIRVNPWPSGDDRPTLVYLVSRLQRSGGHSRVVTDVISAQPDKRHLVLSTEVGGPSDWDYFTQLFAANDNVHFARAPRGNLQTRLTWIQSTLLASHPEHVHLFNHHQDSVAVAALVPELGLTGSFYHHGDHHLCLGVHLTHLTHVDFHPMGYHYCREVLGVNNDYLPLTFADQDGSSESTAAVRSGNLTTATAARSNKVEIPYYASYVDTIPKILTATGGKHIHIGKLTPWAMRRIYAQMRRLQIEKDRLVYIQWTPSVWKTLQQHKVDVYLASFPYGAGLTLIEAMGAGIPVIMHQHMYSRVLSGLELAYPEAFRWSEPENLLSHLANLSRVRLEPERKLSRLRYEQFHRPEILSTYLRDPKSTRLPVPPLTRDFRPRYDEWAAWAGTQLTLARLLYQFAYRSWRRLRRWTS